MAWALEFDGVDDYAEGSLVGALAGDFTLKYVGQVELPASTFGNAIVIFDGTTDYIGVAVQNVSGNIKPKIISNGKTPGNGSTTLLPSTDYTLEVRYVQSTNTASFYIDGVFEYSVNPSGGTTWIPNCTGVHFGLSETSSPSYGGLLLKDGTEIVDQLTPANSLSYSPTASDHSNTGSQPVLTETEHGNDATGVNMPTDGSAWVDLGGGALEIDPSTIPSTSQVFTPTSVFREEVLDVPLLQATPTVYSQEVLPHPSIDATLVDNSGNDVTYQPEVLLAKTLFMESVEGSSEVYGLTVEQPLTLDIDSRIDALSSVPNIYVLLDGAGIFIPVTDRVTMHKVANYLRGEGFTGNDNDVIVEWLFSEGVEEGTYNDRFNNYLATQGYSVGTLQDRQKEWTKG